MESKMCNLLISSYLKIPKQNHKYKKMVFQLAYLIIDKSRYQNSVRLLK